MNLAGALVSPVRGRPWFAVVPSSDVDEPAWRQHPGVVYDHTREQWLVPVSLVPAAAPPAPTETPCTPSGLQLRSYQAEALAFLYAATCGAVLALDVGLGKTLVALQYVWEQRERWQHPFVVVGPLLASGAWLGEHADPAKHYGMQIAALSGEKYSRETVAGLGRPQGLFVHHEILPGWVDWLTKAVRPEVVILDEMHLLRNPRTRAFKAVRRLVGSVAVEQRIGLSATPVVNHVSDLWAQLDLVQPRGWGRWEQFGVRFGGFQLGEYGWRKGDETRVGELRRRLSQVLLRRSRHDVRKDLPDLQRTRVAVPKTELEPAALAEYRAVGADLRKVLADGSRGPRGQEIAQAAKLLSLLSRAKRVYAAQVIGQLLEGYSKVYVGCWFRETAAWLTKQLTGGPYYPKVFGPIDSGMPKPERDRQLAELRELPASLRTVVVGTLGTTGMSLNELVVCNVGVVVDLWYVPMVLLQLEGRLHREGQRARSVLWQYLVAEDTVDEFLFEHLEAKSKAVANVLGDKAGLSLCETLGGRDEQSGLAAFLFAVRESAVMDRQQREAIDAISDGSFWGA